MEQAQNSQQQQRVLSPLQFGQGSLSFAAQQIPHQQPTFHMPQMSGNSFGQQNTGAPPLVNFPPTLPPISLILGNKSTSQPHSPGLPPYMQNQAKGGGFPQPGAMLRNIQSTSYEPLGPSTKVFLKEFDIQENEHFVQYVFMPYFKDIYKDLSARSDQPQKGINRLVFIEYVNLPGILGERFFNIVDKAETGQGDEYIDQKEFMKAMFRIYYSPLETKFKLVFDMFDFDGDGLISKEDIHLVLSHVPIGRPPVMMTRETRKLITEPSDSLAKY